MKKILSLMVIMVLIIAFLVFPAIAESVEPVSETISSPAFMIDLTEIIVSVIGLVFSFLLTWLLRAVVPPIKSWLETKTTAQQRDMINTLIRQLVYAAEQTIGAGKGSNKLNYVCDQLEKRGYTVDLDMIEAAVKEMNDIMIDQIIEVDPPDEDEGLLE